jgi:glycosyltransferase involved in cell wall biosynthesis
MPPQPPGPKPRVVLLADMNNWAYDFVARSLRRRLRRSFDIRIAYANRRPRLDPAGFDLLYVFFWADKWHRRLAIPRRKVVIEVASVGWENLGIPIAEFTARYLADCALVTTPSARIRDDLAPSAGEVLLVPNGYEPAIFRYRGPRTGPLRVAWVGRPGNPDKGLQSILLPACEGVDFEWTDGRWSRRRIARLYGRSDVLAIASKSESQPLPLIEGMACGCFPVATDVGIVSSFVDHEVNGLVVDRSVSAFREAFRWCQGHLEQVRAAAPANAALMASRRTWDQCADVYARVFRYALDQQAGRPRAVDRQALASMADRPAACMGRAAPSGVWLPRHLESLAWGVRDLVSHLGGIAFSVRRKGLVRLVVESLRRRLRRS